MNLRLSFAAVVWAAASMLPSGLAETIGSWTCEKKSKASDEVAKTHYVVSVADGVLTIVETHDDIGRRIKYSIRVARISEVSGVEEYSRDLTVFIEAMDPKDLNMEVTGLKFPEDGNPSDTCGLLFSKNDSLTAKRIQRRLADLVRK